MSDESDSITLREAAKLAGVVPVVSDTDVPEAERPSNQPGAEATAVLDAMLAASRGGKRIR